VYWVFTTAQGDGTAAMCAGNPGIFTLSVHAANNFPARKQQSSLDVGLPDGVGDEDYLATVAEVRGNVQLLFLFLVRVTCRHIHHNMSSITHTGESRRHKAW